MKLKPLYLNYAIAIVFVITSAITNAQTGIGINTTSPLSTLDVNGSFGVKLTAITSNTLLDDSYSFITCNNTTNITLTLPLANTCLGRVYSVKKINTGNINVIRSGSNTIDGATSWLIEDTYEVVSFVSDGVSAWDVTAQLTPFVKTSTAGGAWNQGGNALTSMKSLGTTTNYALPFITNNVERMRISTTGDVGIGTSSFDATYPEQLLVDAGTTTSVNAIAAKGSINNYLQLNIQNRSNGTTASSDLVATADNGTETTNYIDLGINSSGNTATGTIGGINNAYLYSQANDFSIGNAAASKNLIFFTGGTAAANERARIDGNGNVGIGITAPEQLIHAVKYTTTGAIRDDMIIFEERNTTTTATSYQPTLNLVRQVPASVYTAGQIVNSPILNFAARIPGSATFNDVINIQAQSQNATSKMQFYTRTGMTNANPATGTLGLNMQLDGTSLYIASLAGGLSGVGVDGNGNLIRTLSDSRLKTDVHTLENSLEKVMQLRGVNYYWIDKKTYGSNRNIGFIAQELEKIVPEVISSGGEYKSVNYPVLTALLAEAIKEQQKQIEQLKEFNRLLGVQNKAIESKLGQLLKQVNKNAETSTSQLPPAKPQK